MRLEYNSEVKKNLDKIFKNKKIGLIGAGESNLAVLSLLLKYGFSKNIVLFDEDEKITKTLQKKNIKIKNYLGKNAFLKIKNFDILIISPGISPYREEIKKAQKEGTKIISEIWLFFYLCSAKIIGITGTNGKTTTAHLVFEILKNLNKKIWLLGNIENKPAISAIESIKKEDIVILELSSFQLYYLGSLKKSPFISIVLNIEKDHLDWHKNFKNYVKAKEKIILFQTEKDFAILNHDDRLVRKFKNKTKAQIFYFSLKTKTKNCVFLKDDFLVAHLNETEQKICSKKEIKLLGKHNLQNIMAAILCGLIFNVDKNQIKKTVINFKGLPHRLEFVQQIGEIKFYNDSKSTTPHSTIAALKSLSGKKTLILGGKSKGFSFKKLAKEALKNKVKILIIFGENKNEIKKEFLKYQKRIKIIEEKNFEKIVQKAYQESQKNKIKIVLFSPASASFDMFKNYKERGELYKKLVKALKEKEEQNDKK